MSIIDKNNFPEIKARIKEMTGKKVQIGILGKQQLATIATANEFGARIGITPKMRAYLAALGLFLKQTTKFIIIPERSFLRTSFDDKKNIDAAMNQAEEVFQNRFSVKDILDRIGVLMTGKIQERIKSNIPPGNHPFTIEQKGGKNKTLISSGRLGQGISHKVI
jgi:hypothetical protein